MKGRFCVAASLLGTPKPGEGGYQASIAETAVYGDRAPSLEQAAEAGRRVVPGPQAGCYRRLRRNSAMASAVSVEGAIEMTTLLLTGVLLRSAVLLMETRTLASGK